MNDGELESLLREVVEVEDLFGRSGAVVYRTRNPQALGRLRWIVPMAAAAAVALAMTLPQHTGWNREPLAKTGSVDICRRTGSAQSADRRIDTFHPCADHDGYALVLFRKWNEECSCLRWQLHEFDGGRKVVRFTAGEELTVPLDVTNDPPLEQVLLFATSADERDFPADDKAAEELLACLNEKLPPGCCAEAADDSTTALVSCLPVSVTVVPEPFYVD